MGRMAFRKCGCESAPGSAFKVGIFVGRSEYALQLPLFFLIIIHISLYIHMSL